MAQRDGAAVGVHLHTKKSSKKSLLKQNKKTFLLLSTKRALRAGKLLTAAMAPRLQRGVDPLARGGRWGEFTQELIRAVGIVTAIPGKSSIRTF